MLSEKVKNLIRKGNHGKNAKASREQICTHRNCEENVQEQNTFETKKLVPTKKP